MGPNQVETITEILADRVNLVKLLDNCNSVLFECERDTECYSLFKNYVQTCDELSKKLKYTLSIYYDSEMKSCKNDVEVLSNLKNDKATELWECMYCD